MRESAAAFKTGTQKDGTAYYLHRLDGTVRPKAPPPSQPPGADHPRADADLLHRVYSGLLARLRLSKAHREALQRRGLSDTAIDQRDYRSLPIQGRARLARELHDLHGDALLTVPGFILKPGDDGRPYLTLAGAPGLLIPVRDAAGRIVALLVRLILKLVWDRLTPAEQVLAWSEWRRAHQAGARACHYRSRGAKPPD
jgi:hypothetical protein